MIAKNEQKSSGKKKKATSNWKELLRVKKELGEEEFLKLHKKER